MRPGKKYLMNMKMNDIDVKNINKINNKTFFSAIVISFGVMLSKIFGLLRDMVFASFLGTGIIAEAFYVAFRLPNTFRRIFAEGAMSNAFVPFFATKVKINKQEANIFSGQILLFLCIILFFFTIILEIFMPEVISIINPGFLNDNNKFQLAVKFSRISLPYIICISIASFFGSILNSIGSFWQFASISVILNIVMIVGLWLTNNFFSNAGECLVWMMIIGGLIQLLLLGYSCIKRQVFPTLNIKEFLNDFKNSYIELKQFFQKFLPAIVSSGILQINIFVDGIFASFFAGAMSYLYYTDRIGQFPLSLIGYSLSIAILPSLSLAFKNQNNKEISILENKSICIAIFFSLPIMFIILSLSTPILSLIYERGAFTANDTKNVAIMLSIYAISIPFNILLKICFSCFYANKETKTPMKISIISLILNVIVNLAIFKIVGMYCVIIATTISAIVSCITAIAELKKKQMFLISNITYFFSLKILIISIISCFIMPLFLNRKLPLIINLSICSIIYLLLCFAFRVLTKQFLFSILKKQK